jgi:uncharacterized membrane protein
MNDKASDVKMEGRVPEKDTFAEEYDGVSIRETFMSLWLKRSLILKLLLLSIFLIGATAGAFYFFQERQEITSLSFRATFDGADKNQYPSGYVFSSADILANPVVISVYESNDLKRFLALSEFRSSLTVIQTNDRLGLLEKEYGAKLDDRKLTVEQRARLEEEFMQKKKSLMSPEYTLILSGSGKASAIPLSLRAKVLSDLLRAWAEYADKVKGATKYQIPLSSVNILSKQELDSEDFLVAVDILRNAVARILKDIKSLKEIPGSANFRLGEKAVSLLDIEYRMQDLDRFKISPLMGLIRSAGIFKDNELTKTYLEHRIFELKMKEQDALSREKVYEASIEKYLQGTRSSLGGLNLEAGVQGLGPGSTLGGNVPAMIPQLGETFLNSIIKMAQENQDARFRQEIAQNIIKEGLERSAIQSDLRYYERLISELKKEGVSHSETESRKILHSKVITTIEDVYRVLNQSISELNAIYSGLSKANLNPGSTLYAVTEPVAFSKDIAITLKRLFAYSVFAWIVLAGIVVIGVLVSQPSTRRSSAS